MLPPQDVKIKCCLCKTIFNTFKIFILSCLILLLSVIWSLKIPNGKSLIELFFEIFQEIIAILKKKFPDHLNKLFL